MNKMISRIVTLLLCVAVLFSFSACGEKSEESSQESAPVTVDGKADLSGQTLKIGIFHETAANNNILQTRVLQLFAEKWNEEGTLYGAKAEIVEYDNTNNGAQDTEMSIKCANKLINSDHVQVIVPGALSNITQATGGIMNDAKVLCIGTGLSPTWMQQGWDFVYRSALCNDNQIPSITNTMTSLNQKTVSLLYMNTDNCLTFRDSLKEQCAAVGIDIVADEMLLSDGTYITGGITGQVTSAINANPDCVFISSMGNCFGSIIKQLRQQGYKGMIYIGQILSAAEVESIGDEEVNGVIMCSPYVMYNAVEDCTDPFVKDVLQKYYNKYGEMPVDDQIYKTWDAMLLVENAVLAANSIDPEAIQAAISSLKIQGTAGTMDFTTGTNECYFGAQPWVYTGQGSAGAPVHLDEWLANDLSQSVNITAQS